MKFVGKKTLEVQLDR